MNNPVTHDHVLLDYAAGRLSADRRMLVACQAGMSPEVRARLQVLEGLGGRSLESRKGTGLSVDLLSRTLERIRERGTLSRRDVPPAAEPRQPAQDPLRALKAYLGYGLSEVKWKFMAPGLRFKHMRKPGKDGYMILIKGAPGATIPEHTHSHEEWTLILKGAYHSDGRLWNAGDMHIGGPDDTHDQVVTDDQECICIISAESPVTFTGWKAKLLQPFLKI